MKATKDFDFVVRVLNSCKNKEQLKTTEKLFENFKNKWRNELDCFDFLQFMFRFENKRKKLKKLL
jgi:hypothetical protein